MKKIISFICVLALMCSLGCAAFADGETKSKSNTGTGDLTTSVEYTLGATSESWTVTVPSKLIAGAANGSDTGNVLASGYWPSTKALKVSFGSISYLVDSEETVYTGATASGSATLANPESGTGYYKIDENEVPAFEIGGDDDAQIASTTLGTVKAETPQISGLTNMFKDTSFVGTITWSITLA